MSKHKESEVKLVKVSAETHGRIYAIAEAMGEKEEMNVPASRVVKEAIGLLEKKLRK